VLVPHGALAYLPFAALVRDAPAGKRYLVQDYEMVMLASASALPALRARAPATTTSAASVLAPLPAELPGSVDEAAIVASAFTGVRPSTGSLATEGALRSALARSAVIHVASHGVFDARSPMFSGIRLASTSTLRDPDDDGRLETHEVLGLDVRSELVFLSGCETALGPAWGSSFERGEDYVTLAQAFLFAGSRNVVATLWRIDDRGAAEFARRFYATLSHASPMESLAAAQRAAIAGVRYRNPYYWAPYVVSGSGSAPANRMAVARAN
jgi:CHAT domain-containing protein